MITIASIAVSTIFLNRLWTAHPPIVKEAKKWREAMEWLAQNRVVIRWSREGWTHIARIGEAEGRYRATWLP